MLYVLFQGINFHAEGLLRDLDIITQIKSMGLVLFAWGEDLNDTGVQQTLRKQEVDAIIFDRLVFFLSFFLSALLQWRGSIICAKSQDSGWKGTPNLLHIPDDRHTAPCFV